MQCIDGHDVDVIFEAVQKAKKVPGKPCVIICKTTKGKGVDYMEDSLEWHCSGINDEQYASAVRQLKAVINKL